MTGTSISLAWLAMPTRITPRFVNPVLASRDTHICARPGSGAEVSAGRISIRMSSSALYSIREIAGCTDVARPGLYKEKLVLAPGESDSVNDDTSASVTEFNSALKGICTEGNRGLVVSTTTNPELFR